MPDPLPAVNFTLEANDAVRYYQNVCEYGYREGGRQAKQDWGGNVANFCSFAVCLVCVLCCPKNGVKGCVIKTMNLTRHELCPSFLAGLE